MKDIEYEIECLAVSIINKINETNQVSDEIRQKNNGECFEFTVEKVKQFLKSF